MQLAINVACLSLHNIISEEATSLNHLKYTIPNNSRTARRMDMVITAGRMMPTTSKGK